MTAAALEAITNHARAKLGPLVVGSGVETTIELREGIITEERVVYVTVAVSEGADIIDQVRMPLEIGESLDRGIDSAVKIFERLDDRLTAFARDRDEEARVWSEAMQTQPRLKAVT